MDKEDEDEEVIYKSDFCINSEWKLMDKSICIPSTCNIYTQQHKYDIEIEIDFCVIFRNGNGHMNWIEILLYLKSPKNVIH